METASELIRRARAAERDDRLSDGALYGKLAAALELAIAERDAAEEVSRTARPYVSVMRATLQKADNALNQLLIWMPSRYAPESQANAMRLANESRKEIAALAPVHSPV